MGMLNKIEVSHSGVLPTLGHLTHYGDMENNIRKIREGAGLTRAKLAERADMSVSQLVKLEHGERRLTVEWMQKIARALGVPPQHLMADQPKARVVGRVGAGAAVQPISEDGDWTEQSEIALPPGASETTVAVEVVGESMPGIAHDGWLLFYEDRYDPPDASFVGQLCVVWCEDGRVLVKTLGFGSESGLWSLISSTGQVEKDVALKYAALVEWIKPRRT